MGRREGCENEEAEQNGGQSRGQGHVCANTLQREVHYRWPTADLGATRSTTGMAAHAQMAAALAPQSRGLSPVAQRKYVRTKY